MSTCSICLQECEGVTSLPCGHTFHAECLVPWLWKSTSCPNCRFSENTTQEDTTSIHDIRTMIQGIRANQEEQNRKFRINMQRSKNKSARRSLVKTVKAYKQCKEKIREELIEKKNVQKYIDDRRNDTNAELASLYKDYSTKYAMIEKAQKDHVREECKKICRISQKIRRRNCRLLELRHKIIEEV